MSEPSAHNASLSLSTKQDVGLLYGQHHTWLLNWLSNKLDCSFKAADLAHDTFLSVLLRADKLNLVEPRALLTTIAKGLVINHWRRDDLEQSYLLALSQLPEPIAPSMLEQQLALELLERLATMFEDLKPAVSKAFLLAQVDGLKYSEIAIRLKVSQRTVERYVAEALLHCYRLRYQTE